MALFLKSGLLRAHGVVHGFSVRTGGVSQSPFDTLNLGGAVGDDAAAVETNHRLLCDAAGLPRASLATVVQVHGNRVLQARRGTGGMELSEGRRTGALRGLSEADALVASPGVAAGIRTADCVPILFYDPASGAAAAAHAGWRGTVSGVVVRTIAALVDEWHARPEALLAAVGPAIGPCCFEVGEDVAAHFFGLGEGIVSQSPGARPRVNLREANLRLLLSAGLLPRHIDVLDVCTYCDPLRFFSHRRDAGRTGRHLSFVLAGGFRMPDGDGRVS